MLDSYLIQVEKPVRYLGGEMGASAKPDAEVRFVLAFPDVYEVGMSHLGLQILYAILNGADWIAAERVYAPWPDLEAFLRRDVLPLATLETRIPLARVDILGFTLQYELSATNILNMLELAAIPLLASERGAEFPLVIGGGPCASNPEPLADFFDAFLIGDGEEAVIEIATVYRDWKRSNSPKADLLERLTKIPGIYVPSFFRVDYRDDGRIDRIVPLMAGYETVQRRFVSDLNEAPYPTAPVVPFLKTVHDRVSMEIARGCTRGCRFCQAGYIYRPVRERTPEAVLKAVDATLKNTGYDEISLLSLSTGDYGCIEPLLKELMVRYAEERIAVSFPSLRVGTLTEELVAEVKKVRKTGCTLAPEAGSERLRRVINKGITEEDLLRNSFEVYGAGWRLIKLYFMIGLPTETMDDVAGIVDLARKVKSEGKRAGRGGEVNVSVSSFVPKAHTPFQWEPQISYEEILSKQEFLRRELKRKKLNFKWQDAPLSVLEGVIARGDRRLGRLLLKARELGCRFDGWGEHFSFPTWIEAFKAAGVDPLFYLRRREDDEILPWDHLDFRLEKEFLRGEREKAFAEVPTVDCRTGSCSGCGVCDFDAVTMRLNTDRDGAMLSLSPLKPEGVSEEPVPVADLDRPVEPAARIRIRFQKVGAMRFLSHLELLNLFIRAVGRSRIPIRFSQGFHPHPKFSFATALSVGVESRAEYLDMEIAPGYGAQLVKDALNGVLPAGLNVLATVEIPLKSPSLSVLMTGVRYRVVLPPGLDLNLPTLMQQFLALESFPYRREKQGKVMEFDLRRELMLLTTADGVLEMVIARGKPLEFARAILALPPESLAEARIEKLEVLFAPGAVTV